MKKTITISALVIATSVSASTTEPITGNQLHQMCSSQDSLMDLSCTSFINGFTRGFNAAQLLSGIKDKNYKPPVCFPTGFLTTQAVDITKKYITDNPHQRHNPAELMMMMAMFQAFPCK